MPVAMQSYAERFAANWKAQNPTDKEDEKSSLDDSLIKNSVASRHQHPGT